MYIYTCIYMHIYTYVYNVVINKKKSELVKNFFSVVYLRCNAPPEDLVQTLIRRFFVLLEGQVLLNNGWSKFNKTYRAPDPMELAFWGKGWPTTCCRQIPPACPCQLAGSPIYSDLETTCENGKSQPVPWMTERSQKLTHYQWKEEFYWFTSSTFQYHRYTQFLMVNNMRICWRDSKKQRQVSGFGDRINKWGTKYSVQPSKPVWSLYANFWMERRDLGFLLF